MSLKFQPWKNLHTPDVCEHLILPFWKSDKSKRLNKSNKLKFIRQYDFSSDQTENTVQ